MDANPPSPRAKEPVSGSFPIPHSSLPAAVRTVETRSKDSDNENIIIHCCRSFRLEFLSVLSEGCRPASRVGDPSNPGLPWEAVAESLEMCFLARVHPSPQQDCKVMRNSQQVA